MATASEESMATTVKAPNVLPTAVGCEKVLPLVSTDEKHAICDWVEFEKIRNIA